MNMLMRHVDFYGRPRPIPAVQFYLIQAVTFFLAAYLFSSWDFTSLAFIPEAAFDRASRSLLFVYWKTPWFYYLTGQFIYETVPRPGVVVLTVMQLVVIVSALGGLLGILPRLMAWVVLGVGAHLVGAFLLASDTMDASTTVFMFLVFLLAITPASTFYRLGRPLRLSEKHERYHSPFFLLLFFLSCYYFMSAINKIVDIGLSWPLQSRLDLFSQAAIEKSLFTSTWSTSLWFSDFLNNYTGALVVALAVLILEFLAPIVLIVPRLIPIFFTFFFCMHVSIYLSHGYGYWNNMAADLLMMPWFGIAGWLWSTIGFGRHTRVLEPQDATEVLKQ